jgi:hypothetical protein
MMVRRRYPIKKKKDGEKKKLEVFIHKKKRRRGRRIWNRTSEERASMLSYMDGMARERKMEREREREGYQQP